MAILTLPENLDDWLVRLEGQHPTTIDLGLDRVGQVWQDLGAPRPAQKIITVAGTNGKGSTVAYIDSMLRALGHRSGRYTSPHVFHYSERLSIEGQFLPDADWVWALEQVEHARRGIGLTYFEQGTLAGFLLLARARLDFAVLEVGLGGRLDAVNVVDPDCAVLTAIGLDHQEYLGTDREQIGFEKAGIFRAGKPAVCGDPEPPSSVMNHARELGVSMAVLNRDFWIERQASGLTWSDSVASVHLPFPPLNGSHQYLNLATAVAAISCFESNLGEKSSILSGGIDRVQLPGRLQPHPDDARIIVDVGHNPLAAQAIAVAFKQEGRKFGCCVLAMLRDKDASEVARILDPFVGRWLCAGLPGERGRSGQALAAELQATLPCARIEVFETVQDALSASQLGPELDSVLVFGSFNTAAQALGWSAPPVEPASGQACNRQPVVPI